MKNQPIFNSLVFLFIVVVTGCGLKGNPIPYTVLADNKPVVRNLEIVQTENSIILKWNIQDKDRLIKYIGIERSEAGSPGNECKDCPRTFERIGQITFNEVIPQDKELNYIDKKVVKGKTYNYRLMLCEDNGNCSEGATVEINYK